MLFTQFLDDDLGCACYLVGDERAGVAVVVDPPYAIEPLLAEVERRDVRLVGVLETHTHADHVSGHGRLALEHGVPIRVHGEAVRRAAGLDQIHTVPAKHFLQEDQAPAVAQHIAELVASTR